MRRIVAGLSGVLVAATVVAGCEPAPGLGVEGGPVADGGDAAVHGTGFLAGESVTILQCATAPVGIVDCDLATSTTVGAAADGSFDADVPVHARLQGWGRSGTDCRTDGACVLAARVGFDGAAPITVPLAIDPSAPLVPDPSLTASAATDLVDRQVVSLEGRHFSRSGGTQMRGTSPVRIVQCLNEEVLYCRTLPLTTVTPDPGGDFTVALPVSATFDTEWGAADCRSPEEGCYLLATRGRSLGDDPSTVARLDLHFDPDAPLLPAPPSPSLSASRTTGLGDFQGVTLRGTGFEPTAAVAFKVCRAEDTTNCDMRNGEVVVAGLDGSVATEVTVWPSWTRPGWEDSTDCRVEPGCVIVAQPYGSETPAVTLPLAFGPPAPSRGRYLDPVFDEVDVDADVVYRDTVDNQGRPVQLKMDIFRPAGDTATNRPVMMWMHGGFFTGGDKSTMHADAIASAQRGYVGVSLQYRLYRGSEGWRDSFRGSLDAYDDATAAVQWLQAHAAEYGINPEAIIAGGYSAGAVTALNLAYLPGRRGPSEPLVAGVVSRGGILYTPPTAGDPPVIAFQGSVDDVTDYPNIADICPLATTAEVPCELVTYDGHTHTPGDLDDVHRRAADFLATHVLAPLGYPLP